MADYNKLKVTELKEELKKRGIPATGLKLKQQFVDKLVEADTATATHLENPEPPTDDGAQESSQTPLQSTVQPHQSVQGDAEESKSCEVISEPTSGPIESQDRIVKNESLSAETKREETPYVLRSPTSSQQPPETNKRILEEKALNPVSDDPTQRSHPPTTSQSPLPKDITLQSGTATPSILQEVHDDSKKRKRRSVTPPPTSEDVAQKRARLSSHDTPIENDARQDEATNGAILDQEPTDAASLVAQEISKEQSQGIGEESTGPSPQKDLKTQDVNGVEDSRPAEFNESHEPKTPSRKNTGTNARFKGLVPAENQDVSPSPRNGQNSDENRPVARSLHPATSSLYIRNLKRPLQLPALKNHLISLATPLHSSPKSDIVEEFYLDGIKTHALVRFASVSAASRVRSALHNNRWPEEKSRETLWVDFVPDEKVNRWIETEKTSGGSMTRWEIVYDDTGDEIRTTLQEVGVSRKPSAQLSRPNKTATYGEGVHPVRAPLVHPDRANFVSREDYRQPSKSKTEGSSREGGNGFQALDDLFLSTNVKPKLYFKPVAEGLATSRGRRFRDLLHVPEMRGRGAEQEMKRYSFEDGDYWIDKGPEFGYSRGGHRGRGGGRGSSYLGRSGRANDGWRGRGY